MDQVESIKIINMQWTPFEGTVIAIWVDEDNGRAFCLLKATDENTSSIIRWVG